MCQWWSRTSSLYQKAIIELSLKMCNLVQYQNEIPVHIVMFSPQNASYSEMYSGQLCVTSPDPYMLIIWLQSQFQLISEHKVALIRHSLNYILPISLCVPLDWMGRGTQIWDTQKYI